MHWNFFFSLAGVALMSALLEAVLSTGAPDRLKSRGYRCNKCTHPCCCCCCSCCLLALCNARAMCWPRVQCESCLCAHWHRARHCCWYGTPSPTPHFITLVSPSRTLPSSPHHPQAIKSRCPVWASATLCCMRRVWIYSVPTERACLASLVSAGREGVYLPLAHPQHAAARQAS